MRAFEASFTSLDDLALIASEILASVAAVFSPRTIFKHSTCDSTYISREILTKTVVKGIGGLIVSSGYVNAVRGKGWHRGCLCNV